MMSLCRSILFLCSVVFLYGQDFSVTILVIPSPSMIDSTAVVCIAGEGEAFGNWNPGSVRMEKFRDTCWSYSGKFVRNTVIQFKITAGSWESEAIYDTNTVPVNTIFAVTKDTTVILRPLLWKTFLKRSKPESRITGTVAYHRQLSGEGLNHKRDIIVWLPPSYEQNRSKRYPVLYMHDGQNIFDPATAFTGYDWRVDEVADSLIRLKMMEEIIIVGIYNSPDRLPEYSDSPLGTAYRDFVISVVKPLIDSTYRTKPDRKHTAVMGSSLGGLSAFIFAWKRPDIFGVAGCLSTSFWYDNEKTLKEIKEYAGPKKDIRIYLDCGGREKELVGGYRRMVDILKKKGFVKGKDLGYYLDTRGVHNEHSWAKRVWKPLLFMFGKK